MDKNIADKINRLQIEKQVLIDKLKIAKDMLYELLTAINCDDCPLYDTYCTEHYEKDCPDCKSVAKLFVDQGLFEKVIK